MKNLRNNGFGTFEALFGICVIAVIGSVIFYVLNHQDKNQNSGSNATNSQVTMQSGEISIGKLSIDKSKIPERWGVTSKTHSVGEGDYDTLGFRYSIEVNNAGALQDKDRNNPDLCYASIRQIFKNDSNPQSGEQLVQKYMEDVKSEKSNLITLSVDSPSKIKINTSPDTTEIPANKYQVSYEDKGQRTYYNNIAYYVGGDYAGQIGLRCNSQKSFENMESVLSEAVKFN